MAYKPPFHVPAHRCVERDLLVLAEHWRRSLNDSPVWMGRLEKVMTAVEMGTPEGGWMVDERKEAEAYVRQLVEHLPDFIAERLQFVHAVVDPD